MKRDERVAMEHGHSRGTGASPVQASRNTGEAPVLRSRCAIAVILTGLIATLPMVAHGEDVEPTTQPTTLPASEPTTQPTSRPARIPVPKDEKPLDAIRRGAKVYDQLDLEYAMELFEYSTPEEKQFVKAQCQYSLALTAVEHAMRDQFGKAASDAMIHAVGEHTAEDFDKATIDVDDDTATVELKGDDDATFTMTQVDGVWKLSAKDAMADLDAETIKGLNESEQDLAAALPGLEKEIRDGKYKTAEEAKAAAKALIDPEPPPAAPEVPTQKA